MIILYDDDHGTHGASNVMFCGANTQGAVVVKIVADVGQADE
jgi:hypothetical protein